MAKAKKKWNKRVITGDKHMMPNPPEGWRFTGVSKFTYVDCDPTGMKKEKALKCIYVLEPIGDDPPELDIHQAVFTEPTNET